MGDKGSKVKPPKQNASDGLYVRGNLPNFGPRLQLFSKTGFLVAILPDGQVIGVQDETNKYTFLEFSSAGVGDVRIRGMETNLYLSMDEKGILRGVRNANDKETIFIERPFRSYTTYLSLAWAHMGWFMGIKKTGKPKPGKTTAYGQKATQFLQIRLPPSETRV